MSYGFRDFQEFENGFLDSRSEFKYSLRSIQILLDNMRLQGSK